MEGLFRGYAMIGSGRDFARQFAPDAAILRKSKPGYVLTQLGVSRRPGDTLFFGNTAAAVLDRSEKSNLFVAS